MNIKIKKLKENATIPTKSHLDDAGIDLYVQETWFDEHGNFVCDSGIAIEIPKGYVGLLFTRSSIAKKNLILSNSVGVIDSNYRGSIIAKFKVTKSIDKVTEVDYTFGDRFAQLIIIPYPKVELIESEELSSTERNTGGYGSTGN